MSVPAVQMGTVPRNWVLAALPAEDLFRLRADLEPVVMVRGDVLAEAGQTDARIYFVETGVVARVAALDRGAIALMATVGREGIVGLGAVVGSAPCCGHHVVRVSGFALAMEAAKFRAALHASPKLRATCGGYCQAFVAQVLQTIACQNVHTVEQRCARWLLVSHDRNGSDDLLETPRFLAEMLGVSSWQATAAMRTLRKSGLIGYRQGIITVADRKGLEAVACECYRIDLQQYQRPLPAAPVQPAAALRRRGRP